MFSRRRDLDVARESIVASLIFFHTARIFDDLGFYVKNEPQEPAVTFIVILAAFLGMPLMFSIAGFAIWHSLQKRTAIAFVRERLKRLLIPFVFSLLVLVPPQVYYQLCSDPAYQESYAKFYPRFFDISFVIDFPRFFSASPATSLFQLAHLWFLYNLLLYTLILLPVFLYLRRSRGRQLTQRLVSFSARPGAFFLLGLPIAMIEAALGTDMSGGWNQLGYIFFVIYGYLFAAEARFRQVFCQYRKSVLLLAVIGSAAGVFAFFILAESADTDPLQAYDLASVMLRFFKGIVGWCWIVAILGFLENARKTWQIARTMRDSRFVERVPIRHQAFLARVERYANEAVLPFYLLHQTIVVVIGFYVVQWHTSALLKFSFISLTALAITLLLYETLVKRTRLTRFLFGMKSETVP